MSNRLQSHFFWGPHAPLSALTGAGLLIMASVRMAYAILCAGCLVWVFGLCAIVFYSAKKILPKKGRALVVLFLSSLFCSLYILLTGFLNPLLVTGAWFFLVLVPPCCMGSGFFHGLDNEETAGILAGVFAETACLGLLIMAVSLIREPLGLGSLSFPGGVWGIYEFFSMEKNGAGFLPIRVLSVSAGGFLILGFGIALFRHLRIGQSGDKS